MNHPVPGIADEEFVRGDTPMTKQEVRILALVKARISAASVIVDIGAGTGSLTVEAALLAPQGRVFAIEQDAAAVALIRANAAKFGAANVEIVAGTAPAALAGLPAADVIFIGGSGGRLAAVADAADRLLKPGGRLVVTAVTVETLHQALAIFAARPDYRAEAAGLQVTRLRRAGAKHLFQANNPVYLIVCTKGGPP
jgi:precorrin-6Y C5,15-methyltransferase (decarboxylating) CbiT subunit